MLHRGHPSLITSTLLNNMLDSLIKILPKLWLSNLKEKLDLISYYYSQESTFMI